MTGKSEVLGTLARYYESNNIRTLYVTSSSKALDELRDRSCNKFGVKNPGYYSIDKEINFINAKGFWSSNISKTPEVLNHLRETKVILFDEVEQSLNDAMCHALDNYFPNVTNMYGFSATANKSDSERLIPKNKCYYEEVNSRLVKYFGYATCYRLPDFKIINIIEYKVGDSIKVNIPKDKSVDINFVKDKLYDNGKFIHHLNKLLINLKSKGTTFIPINRTQVIYNLIDNLIDLNILILDSTGFKFEGKYINLNEAKELVRNHKVDVFFSTKSGYNSLDFPNIKNIYLMLEEKAPHNILQALSLCFNLSFTMEFCILQHRS
jgi:hypothetical protein